MLCTKRCLSIYTGRVPIKKSKLRRASPLAWKNRISQKLGSSESEKKSRIPETTIDKRVQNLMEMDLARRTRETYNTAVQHYKGIWSVGTKIQEVLQLRIYVFG